MCGLRFHLPFQKFKFPPFCVPRSRRPTFFFSTLLCSTALLFRFLSFFLLEPSVKPPTAFPLGFSCLLLNCVNFSLCLPLVPPTVPAFSIFISHFPIVRYTDPALPSSFYQSLFLFLSLIALFAFFAFFLSLTPSLPFTLVLSASSPRLLFSSPLSSSPVLFVFPSADLSRFPP